MHELSNCQGKERRKKQPSKNQTAPTIELTQKKGHNIQKDKLEF